MSHTPGDTCEYVLSLASKGKGAVVDGELGTATPRRLIREPRVDAGDLALGALCGGADAVIDASIFICMTCAFVSYGYTRERGELYGQVVILLQGVDDGVDDEAFGDNCCNRRRERHSRGI